MAKVTVEAFEKWLSSQDPAGEYRYSDNHNCCFARFLKETGVCANPFVTSSEWEDLDIDLVYRIPDVIASALYVTRVVHQQDWNTFEGAYIELKRLMEKSHVPV